MNLLSFSNLLIEKYLFQNFGEQLKKEHEKLDITFKWKRNWDLFNSIWLMYVPELIKSVSCK